MVAGARSCLDIETFYFSGRPDGPGRLAPVIEAVAAAAGPRPCVLGPDVPLALDVVADIAAFLVDRIETAVAAGVRRERLVIDPGFGFGKTVAHNLAILGRLGELVGIGPPVTDMASARKPSTVTSRIPRGAAPGVPGASEPSSGRCSAAVWWRTGWPQPASHSFWRTRSRSRSSRVPGRGPSWAWPRPAPSVAIWAPRG